MYYILFLLHCFLYSNLNYLLLLRWFFKSLSSHVYKVSIALFAFLFIKKKLISYLLKTSVNDIKFDYSVNIIYKTCFY